MGQADKVGFLDTGWARGTAVLCAVAAAGALAYIHRADLWPAEDVGALEDVAYRQCFTERAVDIDSMAAEGTISGRQALQFKARAVAMCRDLAGGNNQTPPGQ
ncbi:MAG: hypothetical protein GY791_16090 [Alphaproteobacteria bacterium]|nr:hypothetical protein [Alphaproteobacteria bacterium]